MRGQWRIFSSLSWHLDGATWSHCLNFDDEDDDVNGMMNYRWSYCCGVSALVRCFDRNL